MRILRGRSRLLLLGMSLAFAGCSAPATTGSPAAVTTASPSPSASPTVSPSVEPASPSADASVPPDPDVFAYDAGRPRDAETASRPGTDRTSVEHVTYAGADGERVPALLSLPRNRNDPVACILLGHGFRGDKSSLPIGDLLSQGGYGSFAIDARFHGERRDDDALRDVATDPALLARMLRETVIDLRRGIDYLVTRPECDGQRIGFLGASMGGFVGSLLAGADDRVQAPVLLVSGADWRTMLQSTEAREFGLQATSADIAEAQRVLDPVDPVHWVGRIAPRPVLMIAGDADEEIPPASARALHAAAREPKQVLWYRGGHSLPAAAERDRILTAIALWLSEHLATR